MNYIATFFSHYSAAITKKKLDKLNIKSHLAPTPRAVSSSCGTCLIYESDNALENLMDCDFESIFLEDVDGNYKKVISNNNY